jgi:hypothetical protein
MLAFLFLSVVVVLLVIFAGVAYRSEGGAPESSPEQDRRLDRLVTILDTDVMEGIIQRARSEGRSETEVLNRLLRSGLGSPPHS